MRIVRSAENVGFLKRVQHRRPHGARRAPAVPEQRRGATAGQPRSGAGDDRAIAAIGAVGGRLILPDGRFQEAGCIIWSDGSCEGYGRGDSPSAPEYAFTRDVDYCSGAFLLTPRQLYSRPRRDSTNGSRLRTTRTPTTACGSGRRAVVWCTNRAPLRLHVEFASSTSPSEAIRMQTRPSSAVREKHAVWLQRSVRALPGRRCWTRARRRSHAAAAAAVVEDRVPHVRLGSGYPRSLAIVRAATHAWISGDAVSARGA